MPRTERCPSCLGVGEIEMPTVQEKLVNHMIYTQGLPGAMIGLNTQEVAELLDELGVSVPPEASGDARPV